jgi:hypothetical protein
MSAVDMMRRLCAPFFRAAARRAASVATAASVRHLAASCTAVQLRSAPMRQGRLMRWLAIGG